MKIPYSSFKIKAASDKRSAKKKEGKGSDVLEKNKVKPKKLFKKGLSKESAKNLKQTELKKAKPKKRPKKEVTKEPAKKLEPNDLVEYSLFDYDGTLIRKTIHLVIDYNFERDPEKIDGYPTIELVSGQAIASNIFFWGDERLQIKKLNHTHKLELKYNNGVAKWKLTKKRSS